MSATKSSRFFWSDLESDETLKLCSFAAQGLWMRMLCICAKAEPTGYLVIAGHPLSAEEIARVVGGRAEEVEALLAQLQTNQVFSVDRRGVIYSRRMVRDAQKSAEGKFHATKTGHGTSKTEDKSEIKSSINEAGHQKDRTLNSQHDPENNNETDLPIGSPAGSPIGSPSPSPGVSLSFTDSSRLTTTEIFEKLVNAAADNVMHDTVGIEMIKPILDLVAQGCDLETVILPVIRETVPNLDEPLRTWSAKFLREACFAKRDANRNVKANGGRRPKVSDELWEWRLKRYDKGGDSLWEGIWGPPPGAGGCEVPAHLLAKRSSENEK